MSATLSPWIVYGDRNPPGTGSGGSANPNRSPSIFDQGVGLMDGRAGYNVTRAGAIGWLGTSRIPLINQVPSTISAVNLAAAQSVTAGTAMTLAAASTGITVVATGGVTVWSSGTVVPAGALVMDGQPGLLSTVGAYPINPSASTNTLVMFYDPTKALSRNVRITTNADDTGGFYTVAGNDIYGFAMSEKITGVSSGVAAGKKAFKFIRSITPSGTINSTSVTVGTGDVFGFPIRVGTVGYADVWWNSTLATALATPFGTASAFTFADATTPATQVTGDVRGTIYAGTANPSNGTLRLQVYVTLDINAMTLVGGVFGVAQA